MDSLLKLNFAYSHSIVTKAEKQHVQRYQTLCMIENDAGSSVCDVEDTEKLAEIIKHNLIDHPSQKDYNFSKTEPRLDGQIGAPKIVDELLGQQK